MRSGWDVITRSPSVPTLITLVPGRVGVFDGVNRFIQSVVLYVFENLLLCSVKGLLARLKITIWFAARHRVRICMVSIRFLRTLFRVDVSHGIGQGVNSGSVDVQVHTRSKGDVSMSRGPKKTTRIRAVHWVITDVFIQIWTASTET